MVDEGRVTRLLRGVSDRVARLRAAAVIDEDDRGELWLEGIKYLLITTIEGCIDVAQHIASAESFAPPDSNAGAIRLLGTHGIVETPVAETIARAVGFRNVLVHQYAAVDDEIVLGVLGGLEEIDAFVAQVSAWLLDH